MNLPFLPYAKQSIAEEDVEAASSALRIDLITRGPPVEQFEEEIASYCQAPFAVAFNSGTAALFAAYFAARLTPFDRLFSTPNSFIATVGAPLQLGIKPQWIDIDRSSGNLDLSALRERVDFHATRGRPFIVPVHFAGIAVDMEKLESLVKHPDTVIIEDAAHALGSFYPSGQKVGSCAFSQMTIFSFHPAKTITTGEGGMVTTRDPELYHRLRLFRDNGIEREAPYLRNPEEAGYYEVHAITGNYHFTSFQAALGLSQMKRLDLFIAKRRALTKLYRELLKDAPHLTLLTDQQDDYTAFHLFVVQIDFNALQTTKNEVMHQLKERGIGSQVHYIPLYKHPLLALGEGDGVVKYPQMAHYYQCALSLPLYYDLNESDVQRVCETLKAILFIN